MKVKSLIAFAVVLASSYSFAREIIHLAVVVACVNCEENEITSVRNTARPLILTSIETGRVHGAVIVASNPGFNHTDLRFHERAVRDLEKCLVPGKVVKFGGALDSLGRVVEIAHSCE